jgi:hypothetical protein
MIKKDNYYKSICKKAGIDVLKVEKIKGWQKVDQFFNHRFIYDHNITFRYQGKIYIDNAYIWDNESIYYNVIMKVKTIQDDLKKEREMNLINRGVF